MLAAIAPLGALILSLVLYSCAARDPGATSVVTVAAPALVQNALLYIAQARHLYAANGVRARITSVATGPQALSALARGSVDLAETAEFPVVESVMRGARVRILATNDVFENDYLVVRRGRGIATPADLAGRRIGVAFGTVTEFYLARYLALHGLSLARVREVDVQPADFVQAMLSGRLDAVVAWESYVRRMVAARPGAFGVWPVQSSQAAFGVLVGRSGWVHRHGGEERGFLKALAAARDFLDTHPRQARAIVAKELGERLVEVSSVWPDHEFSLTLDDSLLAAMGEEGRWLGAKGIEGARALPDFERYLSPQALSAARPNGVSLMR